MKHFFLRLLSVLLVVLLITGNTTLAFANNTDYSISLTGEIESQVYTSAESEQISVYSADKLKVGRQIAQGMINKDEYITVSYSHPSATAPSNEEVSLFALDLFNCALGETDSAIEGDYLRYSYTSCQYQVRGFYDDYAHVAQLEYTYNLTYYINKAQEDELTLEINKVLNSFGFTETTTERQKVDKIYAYITNNILYDYENLNDDDYSLKYTAYAALMHKTAVCEGYAVLLYRMLKQCNIDTRVITGYGGSSRDAKHAWNIVRLDDEYYYCDSTWDAEATLYNYYLKSAADFPNHTNDDIFKTDEFKAQYPISTESISVTSAQKQNENFKYVITGGRAVVTEYIGSSEEVTVPATIDGALVFIGAQAFNDEQNLKVLSFSEGIAKTGVWPVYHCSNLKTINYPSTMIVQDYEHDGYTTAPVECPSLENITVAQGNKFIKLDQNGVLYTYNMKTLLKCPAKATFDEYTVAEGVQSIGNDAFEDCANIKKITLPSTIKSICSWAFSNASSLKDVNIPDGVQYIGQFVFINTVIDKINIPKSVTVIRNDAFILFYPKSITVDKDNEFYYMDNGALCDINNMLHKYAGNAYQYTVPNGITNIGNYAFENNKTLKKVTLPNGLTTIGLSAFNNCDGLEHITIPSSTKTIDEFAFSDCDMLASIYIPSSVTNIKNSILYTSPYRYTTVYGKAGSAAHSLAQNSQLTFKDLDEFKCENGHQFEYTQVYNDGLITTYCYKCTVCGDKTKQSSIVRESLDNAVIVLAKDSYEYTGKEITPEIDSITLNGKILTENVDYKIAYTIGSEQVGTATVFIDGIGNYYGSLFANFEVVPANIENATIHLEGHSFKFTGEEISPKVTVFFGDNELSQNYDYTVSYQNNINEGVATVTITGMGNFKGSIDKTFEIIKPDIVGPLTFSLNQDNASYSVVNCDALATGEIIIPSNYKNLPVTKVDDFAFEYCTSITSVIIPDSVTIIGDFAFEYCSMLEFIEISDNVKSIGKYAFEGCDSLNSISLGKSLTSIGMCAFGWCHNLTSITLPSTLTSIADNAFLDCDNLKYVFYSGTKQQWANINFGSNNADLIYAKMHYNGAPHKLSWVTVKKATVNATGLKQKKCAECGEVVETAKIKQLTPATPKVKSVETTSSGVKVTWGKVSGADKYLVYRKTYNSKTKKWSGWSALTNKATLSSYTDKTAKSGTYYTYTVKAQNEAGYSGYTSGLKTYFLSTPKLSSVTSSKSGVTVKWGKVTGASGYYVYRKTYNTKTKKWSGWTKIATAKGKSKVSYLDKSAKKGTNYKYTVIAYYSSYKSYYNTSGLKIKDRY